MVPSGVSAIGRLRDGGETDVLPGYKSDRPSDEQMQGQPQQPRAMGLDQPVGAMPDSKDERGELDLFGREVPVPAELADVRGPVERAVAGDPNSLNVGGRIVSLGSSLCDLRQAAVFLGLSKSGTKQQIWERLKFESQQILRREQSEVANQLRREMQETHVQAQEVPRRQPSDADRAQRELTHIPFADWCDHCISCKSRNDRARARPQETARIPYCSMRFHVLQDE